MKSDNSVVLKVVYEYNKDTHVTVNIKDPSKVLFCQLISQIEEKFFNKCEIKNNKKGVYNVCT